MTTVLKIKDSKRLGTLVVTPDEYRDELVTNSAFLDATPTQGEIPDGYVGIMPLFGGKLYAWVIVKDDVQSK